MNERKQCLFCTETASYYGLGPLDTMFKVECPNCGTYTVSDSIARDNPKEYIKDIHLISGLIREKNELGLNIEVITIGNICNLVNDPLIPRNTMGKLDKILLHFYRNLKALGDRIMINTDVPYAIGYSVNYQEFYHMVLALMEYGLFSDSDRLSPHLVITSITIEGIQRAEQLLSSNISSNKVFVAMGFKPDLLEAYEQAIKPACKECGFNAGLVIETEHNDDITDRIIAEIKQ